MKKSDRRGEGIEKPYAAPPAEWRKNAKNPPGEKNKFLQNKFNPFISFGNDIYFNSSLVFCIDQNSYCLETRGAAGQVPIFKSSGISINNDINTWIHLAYTYDNVNKFVKLYRNGYLVYSSSVASNFNLGTVNRFNVGADGAGKYFNGYMQDLRIFKNVVLNDNQIFKTMNIISNDGTSNVFIRNDNSYPVLDTNPYAWYKFDNDGLIKDSSYNNNTLIAYNNPSLSGIPLNIF